MSGEWDGCEICTEWERPIRVGWNKRNVIIHTELHIYTCLILPVSNGTFLRNAMPPFTCSKILLWSSSLNGRVNYALMIAYNDCNSKTKYIHYLPKLWSRCCQPGFTDEWTKQSSKKPKQDLKPDYHVFTALQCSLSPVCLSHWPFH